VPRAFDTDEHDDRKPLVFTEVVKCPKCGTEQTGMFTDDSMSVEDMVEPPKTEQECEVCLHHWVAEYSGWSTYGDA
jgi:DNA-directed RNA polymerase subunit M/transcription elongation factor TFIIS